MIEALDYSDDDFDRATIAAGVLGEMKATDAVDAADQGGREAAADQVARQQRRASRRCARW